MPVYLRPDEMGPDEPVARDTRRDLADLREGLGAAVRATLVWVVLGVVLLPLILVAMKGSIEASDELLRAVSDYWQEAFMPLLLFLGFGALLGGAIGWRMTSAASVGGPVGWSVGGGAIGIVLIAGVVTATIVFSPAVPLAAWLALLSTGIGGLLAVSAFTLWMT